MDADRFDAFVLSLDRAVPRRTALVGALGTGLTGLLTCLGVDIAEAKKKKRKKCKGGKKKCGKKCISKTACCVSADCPAIATCVSGTCVCPNGATNCADVCVDLANDAANCGACDHVCASGLCIHGGCDCQSEGCPAGCSCGARKQGGAVCFGGVLAQACGTDNECPLGSNCLTINKCSKACVA